MMNVEIQHAGLVTVPVDPCRAGSPAQRVAATVAGQASWGLHVVPLTPDGFDEDAAEGTTTLLCIDSHAKGAAAELAFGSVSEDLVRRATVPVLVCGPRVQPTDRYSRIIVGLDGSDFAERALTASVALAQALGTSLALLEVLPPDVTLPDDVSETAYLSRLRARTGIPTDDYDTIHHHRPAQALIEAADAMPGTIIAVATHGRSGFQRLRMGSVAMDVVRHARGPVLVVPAGA